MQIKNFTLGLLFLLMWGQAYTQVVLTAETNGGVAGSIDTAYVALNTGVDALTGGANVSWDLSSYLPVNTVILDTSDETDNPDFPDGVFGRPFLLRFQVFLADMLVISGEDATGRYDVGRIVEEIVFPITTITGGADDTFTFNADTVAYAERMNEMEYPMTYLDEWSGSRIELTNISLDVAAFGLVGAPIQNKRLREETRSVIGYGQLTIPLEDFSASAPIEVLLVQIDIMATDSFFLAGALAPAPLTAAFGVSQGMVSTSRSYEFYTPGLAFPVATLEVMADGMLGNIRYRPAGARVLVGTQELTPARFSLSPNPLRAGERIVLTTDQDLQGGAIQLYNLSGQLLHTMNPQANGAGTYELALPANLPAGMYTLQAFDQIGRMFKAEKIVVN